jgi:diguanylate cyclase (GGDEF)-like protein
MVCSDRPCYLPILLVILPNTVAADAFAIASTIQTATCDLAIPHAQSAISASVTLSLGVATTTPGLTSLPSILVAAADRSLYQAKALGGDRICYSGLPCAVGSL